MYILYLTFSFAVNLRLHVRHKSSRVSRMRLREQTARYSGTQRWPRLEAFCQRCLSLGDALSEVRHTYGITDANAGAVGLSLTASSNGDATPAVVSAAGVSVGAVLWRNEARHSAIKGGRAEVYLVYLGKRRGSGEAFVSNLQRQKMTRTTLK